MTTEPTVVGVEVPAAVAASLAEELAMLSPRTRRVLEGAAVAGDPFEPELAAAAAGLDEASVMHALDELLAAGLLQTTEVPRRFRFRHPLIRRAVYEAAPGGWALSSHERCARALAQRGASASTLAHHIEHGAAHGDLAAIALLREAGELTQARAPASAARWFGAALRLLPENAPREQRLGLLAARATAFGAAGRLTESRTDLLGGIALARDDELALRTALTAACAGIEHLLGCHQEAHDRLITALGHLPDVGALEGVRLMIELAIDALFRTDYDAMRDWGARALEGARLVGDRSLTATTLALLALSEALRGSMPDAEGHRDQAAALVDATTDAQLRPLDAAAHLATAELYLDHYEQAALHAERALTVGQATGQTFPTLVPTLGTAHFMRGRLAQADDVLDAGVEAARLSGVPQAVAWSLVNRSLSASAAGEVETALATAEEAMQHAVTLSERWVSAWAGLALAAALFPAGRPADAADVLVRAAGGDPLPFVPASWRAMALDLLTRCRLSLGRRAEAGQAAAQAEATAEALGLPMADAWAQRAVAAVLIDAREPAAAAQRASASAAVADRAGAVIEAARARTLAGRALAQAGSHQRAIAELEHAAAQLEACGASRHRDAAERELRTLGRHVHRRSRRGAGKGTGWDSLTERELQLVRLVVDRRTNREIASQLFLSPKTIEAHLRNIFHKVDVSSRVELARAFQRRHDR